MARRNPESRDFAIGLAVTCLLVAGFFAYAHWNTDANPRRKPNGLARVPNLMPGSAKAEPKAGRKEKP